MACEYVYALPTWYDTPAWWKKFIHHILDAPNFTGHKFQDQIQMGLRTWNIHKVHNTLVCDSSDTFMQFVLAYS